jgi:hypothetical protein
MGVVGWGVAEGGGSVVADGIANGAEVADGGGGGVLVALAAVWQAVSQLARKSIHARSFVVCMAPL